LNCKYIKPDGNQCKANALKNDEYCLPHSKLILKIKNAAETGPVNAVIPLHIESIDDLPEFLIDTIGNVRDGLLQAKIGSVIGYLTSVLLRSFELSDLQKRIVRLEEVIHAHFVEIKDIESPNC